MVVTANAPANEAPTAEAHPAISSSHCTVFTPRHPKTKPTKAQVDRACASLDFDALIERALQNTELVKVRYQG